MINFELMLKNYEEISLRLGLLLNFDIELKRKKVMIENNNQY